MDICGQFREWALAAVQEWDGRETAELFLAILEKTGEVPEIIIAKASRLLDERKS